MNGGKFNNNSIFEEKIENNFQAFTEENEIDIDEFIKEITQSKKKSVKSDKLSDHSLIFQVIKIERTSSTKYDIHLKSKKYSNETFTVHYHSYFPLNWLKINDNVGIISDFERIDDHWSADISETKDESIFTNYLILEPEILLSPTTIASGITCNRKAYFEHSFRLEPLETRNVFIIGNIVHETFQRMMLNPKQNCNNLMNKIIQSYNEEIYNSGKSLEEISKEAKYYINNINSYIENFTEKLKYEKLSYKFENVIGCEHLLYSRKYGLKGMADLTFKASSNNKDHIFAAEIKTGSYASIQHNVQILLYSVLLNDYFFAKNQVHQFLLYLKNAKQIEIIPTRKEIFAIFEKRNQIVRYISDYHSNKNFIDIEDYAISTRDCNFCDFKLFCSYYSMCNSKQNHVNKDKEIVDKINYGSDKIVIEYFKKMYRFLFLEQFEHEIHLNKSKSLQENQYYKTPFIIEENFQISNIQEKENEFFLEFEKLINNSNSIEINEGAYVYIQSSETPDNYLDSGELVSKKDRKFKNEILRKYIIKTTNIESFKYHSLHNPNFNKTNFSIIAFMSINKNYAVLRTAILELCLNPSYFEKRNLLVNLISKERIIKDEEINGFLEKNKMYIGKLNLIQQEAIARSLLCSFFHLILGTPGSGKTSTISRLIYSAVKINKKILVVSHTNVALDCILIKLKQLCLPFLRISSSDEKVHPDIRKFLPDKNLGVKEIESLIQSTNVFGSTCYSVFHPLLSKIEFDLVLIDEASQITEPVCIPAIIRSKKFIMVGDYFQLNPIVQSPLLIQEKMNISLFEKLCKKFPEFVSSLWIQYRMNKDIMMLNNQVVYNGQIKAGSKKIEDSTLEIACDKDAPYWYQAICSSKVSVCLLNLDPAMNECNLNEKEMIGLSNKYEASIISLMVSLYLEKGNSPKDIVVLSTFRKQCKLLSKILDKRISVLTIDKSQGIEFEFVIVSSVNYLNKNVLLQDLKRINVCLTRAKRKLIIVGSLQTLEANDEMNKYISFIKNNNWIVNIDSFKEIKDILSTKISISPQKINIKNINPNI